METENRKEWQQAFADTIYWKFNGEVPEWSVLSDVGFMEIALGLNPGSRVLDLGCALGYHSIELSRRGYRVTGLEYSYAFLEEACRKAREASVDVRFVQGDMSQMTLNEKFDAVVLWGNTFGMLSDEENRRTLFCIARVLNKGGSVLIDTQNYTTLPEKLTKDWYFHSQDKDLLFLTEGTKDVLSARFGFTVLAIDVRSGKRYKMPFSWRLYLLPELKRIVSDAGLKLVGIYGDDPKVVDWKSWKRGEPTPYSTKGFTENAAKRILLCQKMKNRLTKG